MGSIDQGPANITIIVARKPLDGGVVDNIQKWGCGAINIDETRIQGPPWKWGTQTDIKGGGFGSKRPSEGDVLARDVESDPKGRWPANLILEHLDGCLRIGAAKVKGDRRGATGGKKERGLGGKEKDIYQAGWRARTDVSGVAYGDVDGNETVDQWECQEGCPAKALSDQSGITKSGDHRPYSQNVQGWKNSCSVNTFENKGDEGTASRFFKQIQGRRDV